MQPLIRRALLFVFAAAGLLPTARAATSPPLAETFSAAAARDELDRLYTGLQAAHYDLFARRPRARYDAFYRRMRAELDEPVDRGELRRELQRFVAYGNVAHARIDPPMAEWEAHRAGGGGAFPLFLRVVAGRVFVHDDFSGVAGIATGDEVLAVDGLPALRWLDRYRALVSADNDYLAYTQLEMQLPLLVWWQGEQASRWSVTLAGRSGGPRELVVPARSRAEFDTARAGRAPRFEFDGSQRVARLIDGIGYLRPGPFYDNRPEASDPWDPTSFRAFIDEAFARFVASGVEALLIDLRDNPGGDNSFSDPMLAWFADEAFRFSPRFEIRVSEAAVASNAARLPHAGGDPDATSVRLAAAYAGKAPGSRVSFPIPLVRPRVGDRFTRPVFLLINRHSYSNTVLVAAVAQDYGFATVLGEETADLASTYGAAEKFTLAASGIEVAFPKARILRPNGDPRARGVVPDIAIETPVAAVASDVVLDEAMRHVVRRLAENADATR